jgi:aldehyde dehydrogenase (NAD+)
MAAVSTAAAGRQDWRADHYTQEHLDSLAAEEVSSLRASFASGVLRTAAQRRAVLLAFQQMLVEGREELCAALQRDLNKNSVEAYLMEVNTIEHEVQLMLDRLEELMAPERVSTNLINLPGTSEIRKDPMGVVLIIGAWNYPVNLSLMPLVGAIAAGNCAVLKLPSDKYSRHSSRAVASLLARFLPPSVVRTVEGDRRATQAVLAQTWDLIFFTGGRYVGRMVAEAAARTLTPTILELGGKSPCIVTQSANVDVAARRIAWGAFTNAGQTCVRPDHCFVHASVADAFLDALKRAVGDFYGRNAEASEWFCRLINERAARRIGALLDEDRGAARVVVGGRHGRAEAASPAGAAAGGEADRAEADRAGRFAAPTVLDFGDDAETFFGSASMRDEIFGPVLPVLRYEDLERDVLGSPHFVLARGEKPLALYCFAEDEAERELVLRRTTSGGACVNDCMVHLANPELPFGGVGASGMGSYHGRASFNAFSHRRSVLIRSTFGDVPARYPPYAPWKAAVLNAVQRPVSEAQAKALKYASLAGVAALLSRTPLRRHGASVLRWLLTGMLAAL